MDSIPVPLILPPSVRIHLTSRQGGVSDSPFHSLNLSVHVGDDLGAVMENRMRLGDIFPAPLRFPRQAHGNRLLLADTMANDIDIADAVYTTTSNVVCAIQTADCLPILLWNANASLVAAVHAGWRGLANNILEQSVTQLAAHAPLFALIGPHISAKHYIVGEEVVTALCRPDQEDMQFFQRCPTESGKYHAHLGALAKQRLQDQNVSVTLMDDYCTHQHKNLFFSARREQHTGRQAALIYLQPSA